MESIISYTVSLYSFDLVLTKKMSVLRFQSLTGLLSRCLVVFLLVHAAGAAVTAQSQPYDQYPEADPPYFRVRYEPSQQDGGLAFGVNYTIWIPSSVESLRGVIVHQHGCGEGSCKSGLSGAYDLHWQALAEKHDCALLSPAYEQPGDADCQLWCDPRNGSSATFQRALLDLGEKSGHPELAEVPWALWGHSGGGHWAGGMVLLHPDRVAAAWLRSGVPFLEANPDRPTIKHHQLTKAALQVPMMCNPGTKEGVTVKEGRFARVWPANQQFFNRVRKDGGLIGVAVDPLTSHECGNQRYLAIRWLDVCLDLRLPNKVGQPLRDLNEQEGWLAETPGFRAVSAKTFKGDLQVSTWLPSEEFATLWMQYVNDTQVEDVTSPPIPYAVKLVDGKLSWAAKADLESGIERFLIYQGEERIGEVVSETSNRFGRAIFQGLLYSDTPTLPLSQMEFVLPSSTSSKNTEYRVVTVNTVGLHSAMSDPAEVVHSGSDE